MNKIVTIFKIPELRNKILFTLGLLMIYRLGFFVTFPFIDQAGLRKIADSAKGNDGGMLSMASMFSGANLGAFTIFGLGIAPYISASIIFQLAASSIPALEKLQKEGEAGRKKINEYTRYATVVICLLQSLVYANVMMNQQVAGNPIVPANYTSTTLSYVYWTLVAVTVMTAGTMFLMWLGEQIDEYGIGNGISLIIMAGIVGRLPQAILWIYQQVKMAGGLKFAPDVGIGIDKILMLIALFIAVVVVVLLITQGQRRIVTHSAKHQRGNRVVGGVKQFLPLRINQSGVMPIIFASSLMMFPTYIAGWLAAAFPNVTVFQDIDRSLQGHGFIYVVLSIILIYLFCYFWTAISFNPKEVANNLRDMGSFIQGYRPGRRTAEYLEKVMIRLTYVGAAFLAIISLVPWFVQEAMKVEWVVANFFGGTGLLIMISVALDLVQKIDSHLIMRNYDSLLSSGQGTG